MMELKDTDLTIIGAGPVGLFAAFYASLRELDTVIIESLANVGGQVANLYPQKTILDIAGFVNTTGLEIVTALKAQMEQFPQNLYLETTVSDVVPDQDGFIVTTNRGSFHSRAILIATGRGAFDPRRLPAEIENDLEGQGVHYFINDRDVFKNHRVLVAGGGDSAVDTALMLTEIADEVHLTHRREQLRAMESAVTALHQSEVTLQTPFNIVGIEKLADGSLNVELNRARSDERKIINVDDVVVSYGFTSENKIVDGWQIQPATERLKFMVDSEQATSIPGVFAVGDVAGYLGKAELIASGFGEVPTAVNAVIRRLYPERQTAPEHSSGIVIEDGQIKR
ncbi:NAD(P)/FAD-dependent oxidoreductase [Weissella muntiaci]|uniref:Ferredoxin--NADP reductase n=1 Tax=Weissella muntiaci TaxID=2508881 RepID=A0A6C2C8R1_9LACO|nr:NAD(P)/FAD-dependent oxidoreductase [Weissella muntiaci]TYC49535.1 NAD(P)/FAD-dependent oxidoreductase [Weissella muntiaci]